MPTAKPKYDKDGSWKYPNYTEAEWEKLKLQIQLKLEPFYPDKNAVEDPIFGHPATSWSNHLLSVAENSISLMLGLHRRNTNEELHAEHKDTLSALNKAEQCLSNLSYDLDIMLGVNSDVLGCRDKIRELLQRFDGVNDAIKKLPKANKPRDAQHIAAVEMAIRVLRILKTDGIQPVQTANADLAYVSDAINILKVLGDGLGLCLQEVTWKGIVKKAKECAPDL